MRSKYTVYSKAGWHYLTGIQATNDAGIVMAGNSPYIVTILSNAPDRQWLVDNLAIALDAAHEEM
jgi:hypothetical protein